MEAAGFGGDFMSAHKVAHEGVVPGVPQFPFCRAEKVDAAVADMGGIPHIRRAENASEGGAHAFESGLLFQQAVEGGLHLDELLLDFCLAERLNLREGLQQLLDDERRGTFTVVVATHTVAYGEEGLVYAEAILIVTSFPLLGELVNLHGKRVLL